MDPRKIKRCNEETDRFLVPFSTPAVILYGKNSSSSVLLLVRPLLLLVRYYSYDRSGHCAGEHHPTLTTMVLHNAIHPPLLPKLNPIKLHRQILQRLPSNNPIRALRTRLTDDIAEPLERQFLHAREDRCGDGERDALRDARGELEVLPDVVVEGVRDCEPGRLGRGGGLLVCGGVGGGCVWAVVWPRD